MSANRKGITLLQVVVVVCVLLSVFSMAVAYIQIDREKRHRAVCASGMNGIGKSLMIYANENDDGFPMLRGDQWTTTPTGTNRTVEPRTPDNRSVSSLLFMLVRNGQPGGLFVCPETGHKPDPETQDSAGRCKVPNTWDFSDADHLDYSYQAPINDSDPLPASGGNPKTFSPYWISGIRGSTPNDVVVLSDRAPEVNQWQDVTKIAPGDVRNYCSPNHSGGRSMNLLKAGGQVTIQSPASPDVGYKKDNIFTVSGDPKGGSQTAVSTDPLKHLSDEDSFLVGPVRSKVTAGSTTGTATTTSSPSR